MILVSLGGDPPTATIEGTPEEIRALAPLLLEEVRVVKHVVHGVTCRKEPHKADCYGDRGYLHAADDDGPYEVDGIPYCGRCHAWLGGASPPMQGGAR